jgi:hypothetical protein
MGVVIDSTRGGDAFARFFETEAPLIAYEVRLAAAGEGLASGDASMTQGARLVWIERTASGEEKRYDVDPETDWSTRFGVGFLSGLPIDWLL